MKPQIDLAVLAAGSAHRRASSLSHARRAAVDAGASAGDWAVDVGGGPGDHAAVWAGLGIKPIVLDPTPAMLSMARSKRGVVPILGVAERLPLAAASVRLVYYHLSIHYLDLPAALAEASRAVGDRGEICIWTLGQAHHETSFQARYFPSVRAADESRFPEPDVIAAQLGALGLSVVARREMEEKHRTAGSWIAAAEARFISTLQVVSDEELAEGVARFRSEHADEDEEIRYHLTWEHLRARR